MELGGTTGRGRKCNVLKRLASTPSYPSFGRARGATSALYKEEWERAERSREATAAGREANLKGAPSHQEAALLRWWRGIR